VIFLFLSLFFFVQTKAQTKRKRKVF